MASFPVARWDGDFIFRVKPSRKLRVSGKVKVLKFIRRGILICILLVFCEVVHQFITGLHAEFLVQIIDVVLHCMV